MKKTINKKSSLRFLSCLMALCMCITVFAGTVGFSVMAEEATNVWDGGTDTYESLDAVLADLGATDAEGYFHIKTPNQLYAVIKYQGGGNKYKLDNDMYLNENHQDYETWGKTAPDNNWVIQSTYSWVSQKPFTGTIDGCGYTIYGLYSSSGGAYSGLIREVKGATTIKNLNVSHTYLDANASRDKKVRAGVIVGWAYNATLTVDGCTVSNALIAAGYDNESCGGIVGISQGSTVKISNSAVTDVKFTSRVTKNNISSKYVAYPFGSFIGGIYENMTVTASTGALNKTQAKKNIIENSYAVNVVNVTNDNKPVYVCGVFYKNENGDKWGYSITANNVYTDATEVPVSANGTSVKLLVSTDGETAVNPTNAAYPIKAVTADAIKGDSAITAMPLLNWPNWTTVLNDYPYYEVKDIVWDGTDTYESLDAVLAELGEADIEGYYHIKTPNQLHAVIKFLGGSNKYKLDNDIYLNESYGNYAKWGSAANAPANSWELTQAAWTPNKLFKGTIDGCGYTIYGLYSNSSSQHFTGLISATSGATVIKNLNIEYAFVNALNIGAIMVGASYGYNSTLTIDACSVSNAYLKGGWSNTPAGGMVGVSNMAKTTINNCAVTDVKISCLDSINDALTKRNPYAYGSFIGGIYQSMTESGDVNHTQAANNIIKNSYALNVKNVSNNNSPIYICGLYEKDSGWGRSITAIDVYTDATIIPASQNINPQVVLSVTIDGYKINNTIKTPETDNFEGIFSNSLWYMGAFENSLPIQKYKTADFTYLDITGEGIDDEYNALDLTYIIKNLLGFKDYKHILGDLSGDGSINIKDLVRLKKIIAQNNVTRPIPDNLTNEEKSMYTPTSVTVTLYDVNTNTYGITWNTKAEPFESVVQVCEGNAFYETNAMEFSASVKKYSTYDLDNVEYDYYVSKAEIKLEPNKTYTYRAIDKTLNIAGETAILSTKSADVEKFTFVHVADSQVDSGSVDPSSTGYQFGQTLNAIKNSATDLSFLLHTGDIVEWSKYEGYWENMLDYNWQYLMSTPLMALSGNHETSYKNGSNEIFKHFNYNIPEQADTTKGFFYTYDYGNVRFIMLNTNRLSSNKLTQDQYNWLVNVLKTNTKKWTIVAMHNPMYSIGNYGSDPSKNAIALSLQEQLSELFAQYKVDLVLQGHDHAYSKTYPITSKGVIDTTHTKETINGITYDVNPKGTIYVMHGAAGNQSREPNANMNADLYDWYSRGQNNSWAEVTVDNDTLTVVVKSASGGTTTTQKSYGIKK